MQKKIQEERILKDDEIDIFSILNSLLSRKALIASITGFVTIFAIIYALNVTPTFTTTTSLIKPSTNSVSSINKLNIPTETKESIFTLFLNQLTSEDLRKKVFFEGDFLTKFNPDKVPIDDIDKFISSIISSVEIIEPKLIRKAYFEDLLFEKPYSVKMSGGSADNITIYLNQLIATAGSETINEFINFSKKETSILIENVLQKRFNLLKLSKEDRLSQIERIKEADKQKISEINDQIERLKTKANFDRSNQIARIKEADKQKISEINDQINIAKFMAKQRRLNKIANLSESLELAKFAGIIDNNFNLMMNDNDNEDPDVNIAIGQNMDIPDWYLFGEKVIEKNIKLLVNRKSDDPFIPELVTLKSELTKVNSNNLLKTLEARQDDSYFIPEIATLKSEITKINSNNLLKTLESRQDDSYFIPEINSLDIEKSMLELALPNMDSVNPMQIVNASSLEVIQTSRRMIVLLGFFLGFLGSIFVALIMNLFKPD